VIRNTEPIPNPMLPDGDDAVGFLMSLLIIGGLLVVGTEFDRLTAGEQPLQMSQIDALSRDVSGPKVSRCLPWLESERRSEQTQTDRDRSGPLR